MQKPLITNPINSLEQIGGSVANCLLGLYFRISIFHKEQIGGSVCLFYLLRFFI